MSSTPAFNGLVGSNDEQTRPQRSASLRRVKSTNPTSLRVLQKQSRLFTHHSDPVAVSAKCAVSQLQSRLSSKQRTVCSPCWSIRALLASLTASVVCTRTSFGSKLHSGTRDNHDFQTPVVKLLSRALQLCCHVQSWQSARQCNKATHLSCALCKLVAHQSRHIHAAALLRCVVAHEQRADELRHERVWQHQVQHAQRLTKPVRIGSRSEQAHAIRICHAAIAHLVARVSARPLCRGLFSFMHLISQSLPARTRLAAGHALQEIAWKILTVTELIDAVTDMI